MARPLTCLLLSLAMLAASLVGHLRPADAIVYCNITDVEVEQLSNGIQISVKADGIIRWHFAEGFEWGRRVSRFGLEFTNAKNTTGENFIDVSKFPVSHIQLSIPQGAEEGIGVEMVVSMVEPSPVRVRRANDRQSVIITVQSSRTLENGEVVEEEEDEKEAKKEITVELDGDLVSVTAVKANIHDVLGEIAKETGANIAVDDAVKAEANLSLRDLPVRDLLSGIASAYGLALAEIDGAYMFSRGVPQDLAAYRLSGTESFPLRYTRAQAASGLLPSFLYSYLHVNEEQNAVVVTAPQQMLDKIRSDLDAVDVAPPQILIEAIAVEFTSTDELDAVVRLFYGDVAGKTTEFGEPELEASTDSRTGRVTYSNIGDLPDDFEARLRALEEDQRANICARPRMAVMNGHSADIFIGQQRFIIVEFLGYGETSEVIQGVDVGVKLRVRPLTGAGGEITLDIQEVHVSNITELDPETGLPVLSARSTDTTVRVMDGETVMIGGLRQRIAEDRTTKIPILGDIPFIGKLFRSRSRTALTSELVVFITPHILTPDGRLADEEQEREIRERFLTPDAADQ
jgi:type IV pilus assembly protein PilQ